MISAFYLSGMSSSPSSIDPTMQPIRPHFDPQTAEAETSKTQDLINTLHLEKHVEGGYYAEKDRDTFRIPSPYALRANDGSGLLVENRAASSSIHHLLTMQNPLCVFHRNRARTVHTLHKGRGRYVIIHADEVADTSFPGGYESDDSIPEALLWTRKARVESFVVGQNVAKGEKLQWIVHGGKYKASFLLPDEEEGEDSQEGLLISETCVPGFEWEDHDFLTDQRLGTLVNQEQHEELSWMLKKTE